VAGPWTVAILDDMQLMYLRTTFTSLILVLVAWLGAPLSPAAASTLATPDGIVVSGNQLITSGGTPVRLIGVNRSGVEYSCVRGWGVVDGPSSAASIQAMRDWHINAVRLGLNEDCWLGINGVRADFGGANYQTAVMRYAHDLEDSGMYVILDLHWTAPGSTAATLLQPMPDADHTTEFWGSVASAFVADPNVVFDVFNEPYGVDWTCWRDGCPYPPGSNDGSAWQAVGMQSLVNSIRATGASQPIMLGGLAFSNDVRDWDTYKPRDPLNQLVASVHIYPVNRCSNVDCWDAEIAPIAASAPVVISEFGTEWTPPFGDGMALKLLDWADQHTAGYLAWTWNAWGSPETLLANYSGEPTAWGADYRAHVLQNAIPRLKPLVEGNAAYARGDLPAAIDLYTDVASARPSDHESQAESAAITGLARFRALVGSSSLGDDDLAHAELQALVARDERAPLARLAAQFWDQYSMTGSARAACAQLAASVDSQAQPVLEVLWSVGVRMQHDDLCRVP
jgi:Cellulase (glycosyl hydrolase family 5)